MSSNRKLIALWSKLLFVISLTYLQCLSSINSLWSAETSGNTTDIFFTLSTIALYPLKFLTSFGKFLSYVPSTLFDSKRTSALIYLNGFDFQSLY